MTLVRSQIMTNLLGLSATFYLGFNLVLRGGLAEIPIVVTSLVALVFYRSVDVTKLVGFHGRVLWAFALLGFALWNLFMIWFHGGQVHLYEPFAKLLVGSLVAFLLAYKGINVTYIRAGLYLSAMTLVYLYFAEYSGQARYSGGMNPNKWSPMLLSYAVAALLLVFFDKSRLFSVLAFLSWCVFALMILIASSRSSVLLLVLSTLCVVFFVIVRDRSLVGLLLCVGLILASYVFFHNSNSVTGKRFSDLHRELGFVQTGKFNTPSGFRYLMWKAGLSSAKDSIYFGSGYDLSNSVKGFNGESEGEAKAISYIKRTFGSFHNTWVDVLVSQGVFGLGVLCSFVMIIIILIKKNGALLMLGPFVSVFLNGLTESTLYMSILAGHLALAGSIFMNWDVSYSLQDSEGIISSNI